MTSSIEYIVYRNQYLRGIVPIDSPFAQQHPEKADQLPVLVTWGSGFSQPIGWGLWKSRTFLEHPERARLVTDPFEQQQAEAWFAQMDAKHIQFVLPQSFAQTPQPKTKSKLGP